jgi:uncharacterized protein YkwD
LELVNAFRQKNGKGKVTYSKVVSEVAMPHSQGMLSGRVPFGHDGARERSGRIPGARGTGENVAYCSGMADPVKTMVDGWIESPGHRRNLLGDWNVMGIAFAHRENLWYGTQLFAKVYD